MSKSLEKELLEFYSKLEDKDYDITTVTKGAFTQSRAKLNYTAFTEVIDLIVKEFYTHVPYYLWGGHRLLGIDGSTVNLPHHEDVVEEFGQQMVGCNANIPRSMARISTCFDLLNGINLDAQIVGFTTSEHTLMQSHFDKIKIKENDIFIMDRLYPSIATFYKITAMGANFCIRMKTSWWKEVVAFYKSDEVDKKVELKLPKKDLHLKEQYNLDSNIVKVRLVKIILANGEIEILATSLLDTNKYPITLLSELYHCRWGVEEFYKTFKTKVEIEKFSGKTSLAIKQDFFAKILMMNITAFMSFPIRDKIMKENINNKKTKNNPENNNTNETLKKHSSKINNSNALNFVKDKVVTILCTTKGKTKKILKLFDDYIYMTKDIIRENRSFPRIKKKKQPTAMAYKSI